MKIRSSLPFGELQPLETSESDTLIISDLHLGHPSADRQAITNVINAPFSRLIINGDILDWRHVNDLDAVDNDILRKLEELQRQGRAVTIMGNHEIWTRTSRHTCLKFKQNHVWTEGARTFIALHGHQLVSLFSSRKLKENALKYAASKRYDGIFVGHSHSPLLEEVGDLLFCNTGSFIGWAGNIAVVSEGRVRLIAVDKTTHNIPSCTNLMGSR